MGKKNWSIGELMHMYYLRISYTNNDVVNIIPIFPDSFCMHDDYEYCHAIIIQIEGIERQQLIIHRW